MFGENDDYKMYREMSLEETLSYLKSKKIRPPDIEDQDWELVCRGAPFSEDELEQLYSVLIDSMSQTDGVLTLGWSGDGPAHSGIKTIGEWAGCFVFSSSDHDDHGPFRKIEEALELDYFWQEGVPEGELWFDPVSVPQITAMKIAHAMCGEEGETVMVNDVEYVRRGDNIFKA